MIPALIGIAAGTGLGMYGARQKKDALNRAEGDWQSRVAALMRQRALLNEEAQQKYGTISDEHNAQVGSALQNWMGADQVVGDGNYAPQAQATVDALRAKTQEQNPWNMQGGATSAAVAQQGAHATNNLQLAMAAGGAADRQRRLGVLRQNALAPYTAGEMSRASRLQRLQQALALRQADLSNGFAIDQANLQQEMNAAGRKGDSALMWGTLLQQLGGGLSGYGAYEAPQSSGAAQSQAGVDMTPWAGYDEPRYTDAGGGMYA